MYTLATADGERSDALWWGKAMKGLLCVFAFSAMAACLTTRGSGAPGASVFSGSDAMRLVEMNPVPEFLPELQTRAINKTGMKEVAVPGLSKGNVTIETFSNGEDKYVSGNIQAGHLWEDKRVRMLYAEWLHKAGGKGDFLDGGANIGCYTLPIAQGMKNRPGAHKVVAIEAMPIIADHLRVGIVANGLDNVIFFPYAVGANVPENEVTMFLDPNNKGASAVIGKSDWRADRGRHVTVGLTTLDAILKLRKEMTNIFFAKFDVEGSEGRVLAGGQKFFSTHPPCVLWLELNPLYLKTAGTSVENITAQLKAFGYSSSAKAGVDMEFRQNNFSGCISRLH